MAGGGGAGGFLNGCIFLLGKHRKPEFYVEKSPAAFPYSQIKKQGWCLFFLNYRIRKLLQRARQARDRLEEWAGGVLRWEGEGVVTRALLF